MIGNPPQTPPEPTPIEKAESMLQQALRFVQAAKTKNARVNLGAAHHATQLALGYLTPPADTAPFKKN
jgi:hypothetical protein